MGRVILIHELLTRSVIGAFFEVYHTLGFGFLEHVYVAALTEELQNRGHKVRREVSVPVLYKGKELARHRLDMIVDDKVVIETKATETLHRGAVQQVTSYLRSTDLEVGLLLHFGPRPEFSRVVCTNSNRADPKVFFQRNPRLPPLPRNVSHTNPSCDPLRDSEPA
jgi:GxxExxY protein